MLPCVVNNISAAYRDRLAVNQVSFSVSPGEIMAILGANGAGKSTLIKAMLELIPRRNGQVHYFGKELSKSRKKNRIHAPISLYRLGFSGSG